MRKALPICRTACARATLSAFAAVIAVLVIRRSWLIPAGTWRKGPKRAGTVGVRVVLIRYQTPLLLIVALAVITICGSLSGVQEFRLTLSEMLIQVAVVVGIYLFIGNSGVTSFGHIGFMCVGFEAREPHRRRPHPASSMEAGKNAV